MSGINKVIILGRLGQDPETKQFNDGNAVTSFSLATSRKWTKDGEEKEETEWHRISAFGKTGEVAAKYLSKGRQVYVEGRLRTRTWEKDGEKRYATEIVAERVEFLGQAGKDVSEDVREEGRNDVRKTETKPAQATPKKVKNYAEDIKPAPKKAPSFDESEDIPF